MKKFQLALLFTMLYGACSVGQAQTSKYPFEVSITGKGNRAIVFIPGFSCSGDVWNETRKDYENAYTCYTLTMAGFAGVNPVGEIKFSAWEKGIATYIIDNKITKPIIIGHSMGGGLAMAIAADYPDLLSGIIVVDALPCLSAMMNPTFKSKENNDCSAMTQQIVSASSEDFLHMQKASIASLMSDTTMQDLVVGWSVKSDRKTFGDMYCDFSNTDLREKIIAIKCPALILLESYFANFKPAMKDQFKNLQTANLQYANKGLHFIMYDDTEWYNAQLKKFLTQ
ncbi:alpha/beta hydrolase [soil metagenome]